ncbi:MAG: hypothetical protein CVU77_01105 [Elusimicrobia bacterium HGW-Elusimicrobia-1]|jgi:spore maturation protein CgeB|nr:MAG: hypothetical protein CVU77_01105 [Elusimicrobia bacterium HGW-Elusimicrobia-1]
MKSILLAGYHNPRYPTITEYVEKAVRESGFGLTSFDDRSYGVPGFLRSAWKKIDNAALSAMNERFCRLAEASRPDLCIVTGGHRISPRSIERIKSYGIKTVLWTIDAPSADFEYIIAAARVYDKVFCGGTEAVKILERAGVKNPAWLPFACSPDDHKPAPLDDKEKKTLSRDVVFVGTVNPLIYPFRSAVLESIADYNLGVWGPGVRRIPSSYALRSRIVAEHTPPSVWTKIYSAAKIVLCMHYADPAGGFPCRQASPRVYEALACGAFVLCDAQPDAAALFSDGEHLVYFKNPYDLRVKLDYYLAHPDDRLRIASAGRKLALAEHTYLRRLETILRTY